MISTDSTGGTSHGSGNPPVPFSKNFSHFLERAQSARIVTDSADDALWLFNSTETRKLYSYLAYAEKAVRAGETVKLSDLRATVAFDRVLQAAMLEAIGVVETQVKAQYSSLMAASFGDGCIYDAANFLRAEPHRNALTAIKRELGIRAKRDSYIKSALSVDHAAPCDIAISVASLGTVSKLYANTSSIAVRQGVASTFGVDATLLTSWLKTINAVRNICAHFDTFVVRAQIPSVPLSRGEKTGANAEPLFALVMLQQLLTGRGQYLNCSDAAAERFTHEATAILHRFEHEHPAVASQLRVPKEFREETPASAIVPSVRAGGDGAVVYAVIKLAA